MIKVVEGKVPAMPSSDFFTPRPQTNVHRLRHKEPSTKVVLHQQQTMHRPRKRNKQYRESFFVQTVIDWNHLSDKIVNAKTLISFKEALAKEDLTPRVE